jgi:hypothetical protein
MRAINEAIEHEKPQVLINSLLELEEEITADLQDLLTMVAVPGGPYTETVAEAHLQAADAEEGYMEGDRHD